MEEITILFPDRLKHILENNIDWQNVQEIRIRVGRYIEVNYTHKHEFLQQTIMRAEDTAYVLNQISEFSLYAYADELKEGFITINGGHRVGLSGKVNSFGKTIETIRHISSMNIRIAREKVGQAEKLMPYLYDKHYLNTLVVGPPQSGKTTYLRDIARIIGTGGKNVSPCKVAIVDERSEIASSLQGVPQLNVGLRTDVMDACPKSEGMLMMIRSMSPEVMVVDEVGGGADASAIYEAVYTGVSLICSIHGANMEDVKRRPSIHKLIQEKVFDRFVILSGNPANSRQVITIFNKNGQVLTTQDGRDQRAMDRSAHRTGRNYVGGV
ncbi:stage III sporulation protein AA [Thalassobacillus sp. CUG 92003]|uniref:stage III sporulation protein AA n=1 Tax=Thalassobacillus sp. CUG 92003 TaxID=2736641 RepID=UPI0015E6F947